MLKEGEKIGIQRERERERGREREIQKEGDALSENANILTVKCLSMQIFILILHQTSKEEKEGSCQLEIKINTVCI